MQELYYKGYWKFIVKVLMKLKDFMEKQQEGDDRISDYLDMDLEGLLIELKNQCEAVVMLTSGNQNNTVNSVKPG